MVVLDCGKKRLGLARFVDKQEKHRGGRHGGDRIRHVAGRFLSELAPTRRSPRGPGHLDFDGAAKATSRMRHDVYFLSSLSN
jgi:hypothetical protein